MKLVSFGNGMAARTVCGSPTAADPLPPERAGVRALATLSVHQTALWLPTGQVDVESFGRSIRSYPGRCTVTRRGAGFGSGRAASESRRADMFVDPENDPRENG